MTGAHFCPHCGSAGVDFSVLEGGAASCRGCNWTGSKMDLLTIPFKHDFANDEALVVNLMGDLRNILAKELGLPYLKFLIKWGFISADVKDVAGTLDRKTFARYLSRIAQAILLALLDERRKIETENVRTRMASDSKGVS